MYKFAKETRTFANRNATMLVAVVTAMETNLGWNDDRSGRCFLYDDIMAYDFCPKRFIEIIHIEINPRKRRCGIGSKSIDLLKEEYPDLPIFVRAGILDEKMYNELDEHNRLQDYIYENIVPFYENNGFIDVNNTILAHQQCVIMCYPESLAQKYIDEAEKWAKAHKSK